MGERETDSIQKLFMDLTHMIFQKNYSTMLEVGVYPGQMPFFKLLSEQSGLSQREIAEQLHVSPPSVTVSIKRMEKNGIVERKPDKKDQRITRIYLTEKGEKINTQVKEVLRKNEEELFMDFEEGEIYLLRRFFQHMIKNVQETMPKDAGIVEFSPMCGKNEVKGEDTKAW